jgi:hypothetical protein
MRIEALEIDDHILDKIEAKHGVYFYEVEEACYADAIHVRKTKEGLYKVFSRTSAGRYLMIVLVNHENESGKLLPPGN